MTSSVASSCSCASALATFVTGSDTQLDLAEPTDGADTDPPRKRLFADPPAGFTHVASNDMTAAAPRLREALQLGADLTETDVLTNLGIAAFYLGDDEAFHRAFTRQLSQSREVGAIGLVLFALPRLGLADLVSGEWTLPDAHATEALQLARSTGQTGQTAMPSAELTMMAALRGDPAYDSLLAEAELVTERRARRRPGWADEGRGPVGHRHPGGVRRPAQPSAAPSEQMSHQALVRLAALDRIEAAVRAGRDDQATRWASDLEDFARATGAGWAPAGWRWHARALLADADESDVHFQ